MTFEKHLRSVSRAASQRLGILKKSWQVFHDRLFLMRWFRCSAPSVLEYCSVARCSAADTHLKLLDHVVSGASFLTGVMFECDLAHCRSVAVLCVLYKIRCNPYSSRCSTRAVCAGAGYTRRRDRASVHLCASSLQNLAVPQDFYSSVSISVERSWWPRIRWCGTGGFQVLCVFIGLSCSLHSCLLLFSVFLLSFNLLVLWGIRTDTVLIALPALHCQPI